MNYKIKQIEAALPLTAMNHNSLWKESESLFLIDWYNRTSVWFNRTL